MYFETIYSKGLQDKMSVLITMHNDKLNAYIKSRTASGREREVHQMNTCQILIGHEVHISTVLCCDEDDYEEGKE